MIERSMPSISSPIPCEFFNTGSCVAFEHHLMRGGTRRKLLLCCTVALLRHPDCGWILWDTGYAPRVLDPARGLIGFLYRHATHPRCPVKGAIVNQLAARQLTPADISTIILSHGHVDHVAGLPDFPPSRIVVARAAWDAARRRRGLLALRKGYMPSMLPSGADDRIDFIDRFDDAPIDVLGPTHDLFGDGSLRLMPLPGHAAGQMGLFFESTDGPTLLCADGVWLSAAYRENRPAGRLAEFVFDDARAARQTVEKLHAFHRSRPDVRIIPSHCPEALERFSQAPQDMGKTAESRDRTEDRRD